MADDRTIATDLLQEAGDATSTMATVGAAPRTGPRPPPDIIGGFRRIRSLGSGGMGDVYLAEQLQLKRQVALKLLRPDADQGFANRFLREAKTMAAVTHPHVVAIHAAGEEDGFLYMALELVPGGDLARLLRIRGRLDEREALSLIAACCRGLEAIEAAGLIHRDIKPANIFLTKDGVPKIGDLGLARLADGEDRMTLTGHSWGTPAYMSPEQVRGEADIDIRTDCYALSATLFCLLTGQPPFQGSTSYVTTTAVLTQPPPDVRSLNRTVSSATAAIIRTGLAKDRRERHPTPASLRVDCERALEGLPLAYAPVPDASREAPTPPPVPSSPIVTRGEGGSLRIDPFLVKLIAYGGGASVVGLVLWSLVGETRVDRPRPVAATTAAAPSTAATSAAWMAAEGEDDRGRWADVRLGEELLRVRLVPALTFTMGSPPDEEGRQEHETPHEVTLTSARWTATTEVTRRQWSAVLDVPVEEPGDLPIANVSWHEVESFLARLRQQGIPARLPTEAEWEQAARAGSVHAHADGPTPAPGAWLQQPPEAGPRPVAQGAANRLGLHDLDGNLAEWTADTWDGVRPLPADPVTDPCETFGGHQVVRGGSWDSTPLASRCAARRTQEPQLRDPRIGFRFVIPMP